MPVKRVRRRRFNFKKFFKFILFLTCIILVVYYFINKPIKNIMITGTNHISDEEIIETAKLEDYPSFLKTLNYKIKKRIKTLPLVKEVEIKKTWGYVVNINIKEYKVLFYLRSSNEYMLDNEEKLADVSYKENIPILINYVPDDILSKLTKKLSQVEDDIIYKISEIEYSPTAYDQERFLLYMNDGNEVYITLNKIKEFNKYTKIKTQLGTKKGILYLDSGNYFEIKE